MKQILFRIVPGAPGVLDCVFGEVEDGQFRDLPFDLLDESVLDLVRLDGLLGTRAYVRMSDFSDLVRILMLRGADIALYQSFVVINLPVDEQKEEKDS